MLWFPLAIPLAVAEDTEISFNRDIRPLLSDRCFQCHGPDKNKRKGALRLDIREEAVADRDGLRVIAPEKPGESELIRRINLADPAERMPPPESEHSLTAEERGLINDWIASGAEYQPHWAFIPPRRAALPAVSDPDWSSNAIDRFILAALDHAGLKPSPPARRERLIRRLSFDITGLPPTLAEIDAFVSDHSPQAIEKVIDQYLARESYGEHLAVGWLDAARYADTNGYNNDTPRYNWRWRDWVIGAFNRNLPFDQFLTEQLAGDLLPEATLDQKLATGFNRNHNVTSEGGIIDEEYRLEYVADRVHTVATTFMALSLRCARCHDHKFDPVTQKEYYALSAFFNQVPESGYHHEHVGNPKPVMAAPTRQDRIAIEQLTSEKAEIAAGIQIRQQLADALLPEWERRMSAASRREQKPIANLLRHYPLEEMEVSGNPQWVPGKFGYALKLDGKTHVELGEEVALTRDQAFSYGAWIFPTEKAPMNILSKMDSAASARGFDLTFENGSVSVHLIHHWPDNGLKVQTKASAGFNRWTHVFATYDGTSKASGVRIYFDGVEQKLDVASDALSGTIATEVGFRIGARTEHIPFVGILDEVRVYGSRLTSSEVARLAGSDPLVELLAKNRGERSENEQNRLRQIYLEREDAEFKRLTSLQDEKEKEQQKLEAAVPTAMVMKDLEDPRDTFVLMRGDYDKPGEKVVANVPAALLPLPEGSPRNRLGLARWLTDPRHPLTARVAVNRLWHHMFGIGIVETQEDFGSQGAWPSHPDLLDWLAVEFVENDWDVKAMIKLIAQSAAYQQVPRATPTLLEADRENRLLARGPRSRLRAEMIRDHALATSGLLNRKVGGPSVKPYQPAGLWSEVIVADDSYSGGAYVQDKGEDLYRRGVYTWWKRTCPPPALSAFDAPDREFCTVQRKPTNTPLQALVMLNDPTFVEAARSLAERMMAQGGASTESRCGFAFRLATSRPPRPAELEILVGYYQKQRTRFGKDLQGATQVLAVGESPPNPALDITELAAWTTVASMILNLDESITR
ncbi:MAG: DUF1553 domain-containing protein [Akkermansiaceae bacterium]